MRTILRKETGPYVTDDVSVFCSFSFFCFSFFLYCSIVRDDAEAIVHRAHDFKRSLLSTPLRERRADGQPLRIVE